MRISNVLPTLLALSLVAAPMGSAWSKDKPSARWMAHCAGNLKAEKLKPAVVRSYCACMADIGEEAEMLTFTQSDLEHSYPPAHQQCHARARRR